MLRVPTPHMADLAPVRDSDTPTRRHSDTPTRRVPRRTQFVRRNATNRRPSTKNGGTGRKCPVMTRRGRPMRFRILLEAVVATALLVGGFVMAPAAGASTTLTAGVSSAGLTFAFPSAPAFPAFPTAPTFPSFPPSPPVPPPIDTSTNGTTSIVGELAPGGEENDGAFDINEFDYHLTALLVNSVLAADPSGPLSILSDGTRRATFFQPDDEEWVLFVRKLTGQALPLPSPATEQATFTYLQSLGTARLEKILSYLIVPGVTLTGPLLGPPTISQATYTTANGQTLLIKSDFGVVTLVDNNPLTSDSGIVEAPMNQGNRQIAWSTAVLLPSKF